MTKRARIFLSIISAPVIIAVIGAGFYAVRFVVRSVASAERLAKANFVRPANLDEPRVVVGEGIFQKSDSPAGNGLGEITEIHFGWPADREGAQMVLVGAYGAGFFDASGRQVKRVSFSEDVNSSSVEIVRLDAAGNYGYFTRVRGWTGQLLFFDREGQKQWGYGRTFPGIDDSAAGDVRGDGQTEFVTGFNGSGGIALIGSDGKEYKNFPEGNVWHVEILDVNGDGRGKIVHSDAGGKLLVREPDGTVISNYLQGSYVSNFALTRWGDDSVPHHILAPAEPKGSGDSAAAIFILDAQGKTVATFSPELTLKFYEVLGTPLKSMNGQTFYAMLEEYSPWERSILSLFDSAQKLVYEEIISDRCRALGAKPEGAGDQLLVGCKDKVWTYDFRPANDRASHNSAASLKSTK
jgi:hypothetical protein